MSELEKWKEIAFNRGRYAEKADAKIEELEKKVEELENAIKHTLTENAHLADGEDCTLIGLKKVVPDWENEFLKGETER